MLSAAPPCTKSPGSSAAASVLRLSEAPVTAANAGNVTRIAALMASAATTPGDDGPSPSRSGAAGSGVPKSTFSRNRRGDDDDADEDAGLPAIARKG